MSRLTHHTDWPKAGSAIPLPPERERRIEEILAQLTLEEKIGQMIQPELAELTAQDVRDYHIGSALNGAGIWPEGNRQAGQADWIKTVDAFWEAAESRYEGRPFRIPFMWATDAVHGHNNVRGATVFPHNIGLGAARDPDLLRRIGEATAREIAATGMDWTFAPTVTTPRDRRWGRYYEGYAEDPEVVHDYAPAMVRGLQGEAGELTADTRVVACVKHWVADGGTVHGADRGTAVCAEDLVRNIHAVGFFSGLASGAQSVMVSFSSWESPANYDHSPDTGPAYNHKVHGSRYLITDVLKGKMGFDGIVISDWDAHAEVAGCTVGDAGYAINAGIDVLMVAGRDAWQSVHRTACAHVRAGRIPEERIDDAVRRVLRVKTRAGLWEKPRPRERSLAVRTDVLGCAEHRALAREAVRKSLVLLKHRAGTLPLSRSARVLVTGSGADDIQKQAGGWTLTWQGNDVNLDDLPGATTVAQAVRTVVGDANCTVDPGLNTADLAGHDVALMVLGEDSYAEMRGTIKPWGTLSYAGLKQSYARDLDILRRLREQGITVVTIYFGGRALYLTKEINLSDAFVAAWLPGTEAGGITDVLFRAADGGTGHDFQGRLGSSWPRTTRSHAVNRVPPHIPGYRVPAEEQAPEGEHEPLFPYGYGLSMTDSSPAGPLPEDTYQDTTPVPPVTGPLEIHGGTGTDVVYRIGGHNTWSRPEISFAEPTEVLVVGSEPLTEPDRPNALALRFKGPGLPAFVYAQFASGDPADLRGYADAGALVEAEVRVWEAPSESLYLACHDDYPAQPAVDISTTLAELPTGEWSTVTVPVEALRAIGSDLRHVDVPFMLYTDGTARLDLGRVRWLPPESADGTD
ncbi:glycoside hydrolase family 3 N-terminal domain-containing protein [Streptomyces sp. NPDC096040]|uniref:glycoside hydrolase family 3 protein n=1 Tax=Streptomyces sp. NPDC096040 TaxID=3155541 RepID=UPI003323E608